MSPTLNFEVAATLPDQNPRLTSAGCALITSGEIILCRQSTAYGADIVAEFLASRDYGRSWSARSILPGSNINGLLRSANLPGNVLLFPSNDINTNAAKIYRSTDGAASWTEVHDFNPSLQPNRFQDVVGFATYGKNSAAAYGHLANDAVEGYDSMVARSTNFGATWTVEAGNVTGSMNSQCAMLAPGPSGLTFAANINNGLYKSTDNGATWAGPATLPPPPAATQTFVFAVTCITDQIILAAGRYNRPAGNHDPYLYRSTNAGSTWTRITTTEIPSWPVTPNQVLIAELHRLTKYGAIFSWHINATGFGIPIRYSIDAGLNWLEPTYSGASWTGGKSYASTAIIVAPDGGVICAVPFDTASGTELRILRGTFS